MRNQGARVKISRFIFLTFKFSNGELKLGNFEFWEVREFHFKGRVNFQFRGDGKFSLFTVSVILFTFIQLLLITLCSFPLSANRNKHTSHKCCQLVCQSVCLSVHQGKYQLPSNLKYGKPHKLWIGRGKSSISVGCPIRED